MGNNLKNVERLCKLHKRAARIILSADYRTPSAQMFNELRWPSIQNRHNYNKAVLTYKALNSPTPEYITNLLTQVFQIHTRNLRSATYGFLSVAKIKKDSL